MPITFRDTKGSALTHQEMDANWRYINQDNIREDLADSTSANNGPAMISASQSITYGEGTLGARFNQTLNVKDDPYLAKGDGVTNDTAAFTNCRTDSGGRYMIPPGTYVVDASPDVWADEFVAPSAGTYLKIAGVTYEISGSFAAGWRVSQCTQRYLTWQHGRIGTDIVIWSDGELPGDSHRIFLPWDIRRDSHSMLFAPETNGGSCDLLWRRSAANADAYGNRINITFDEAGDRVQHSFATTASGAPAFDAAITINAGSSASMQFPALRPQFNQGISVKQRSAGGFEIAMTIGSSTQTHLEQIGGSATRYMTFRDGAFGFFGSTGTSKQTVTGSRGGNAALASLLTALANTGLITDSTTA